MPKGFAPLRTNLIGTVKFFDVAKGFGFVRLEEDTRDAFVSSAVLQQSGRAELAPGDVVLCDVMRGQRGLQVAAIYEVRRATPTRERERAPRGPDRGPGGEVRLDGTVRWFNPAKGFGFVAPDGGGEDVFVPMAALAATGLTTLDEKQRVRIVARPGQKGLQATRVDLV